MFTVLIQPGFCGFGFSRGLLPELRLGVVSIAWCRGSLLAKMRVWRAALERAKALFSAHL